MPLFLLHRGRKIRVRLRVGTAGRNEVLICPGNRRAELRGRAAELVVWVSGQRQGVTEVLSFALGKMPLLAALMESRKRDLNVFRR